MFINGDPSLLLHDISSEGFCAEENKLIQKDFAMLLARLTGLFDPTRAVGVCFRSLQETTVSPDGISHSILSGSIKLCNPFSQVITVHCQ